MDITLGFHYLTLMKVIHRDMNLGNFLLSYDGFVRVTDFGESKSLENDGSNTADVGAVYFRAPEMFWCTTEISRSDVWSFGVVLSRLIRHGNSDFDFVNTNIPSEFTQPELHLLNRQVPKAVTKAIEARRTECISRVPIHFLPVTEKIISPCLQVVWEDRPTFLRLISDLSEFTSSRQLEDGRFELKLIVNQNFSL